MKQKELANVLLKILGVSTLLYAVPSIGYSIFQTVYSSWLLASMTTGMKGQDLFAHQQAIQAVSLLTRECIECGVGLLVIAKSQKIAEFLFKNESE